MKNDARKMALENQIELAQQNAIDFTHACMTIALHDVFGVGKDRLDKVTQRKDEINGELMRRMAIPAKNQKAQLNEAEKWLVGLLPEGVVSVFRVPVIKGVPRKRREVQLKMAIDRAATLEWRGYATACAQVLGFGPRRLEKLRQETIANFGQLNEWVETDGCARDAYKTEVEVLDVPDEAVLEKTAEGNGGDDTSAASAGGTAGSEPQTGALCAAAFGSRGAAACGSGNFIGAQLP